MHTPLKDLTNPVSLLLVYRVVSFATGLSYSKLNNVINMVLR